MPLKLSDYTTQDSSLLMYTAGETITSGDLVIMASDKKVYRAKAALGSLLNRQTDTLTSVLDTTIPNTTYSTQQSNVGNVLSLSTGNCVVITRDDSGNWAINLIDPTGTVLIKDVYLPTTPTGTFQWVKRVDAFRFAVVWQLNSATSNLYWKIYNNDGSNGTTASGTISGFTRLASSDWTNCDVTFTSDSYLVYAYGDTNNYPHLQSWTLAGVARGYTSSAVIANAGGLMQICETGGMTFFAFYNNSTGTLQTYTWQHSISGTSGTYTQVQNVTATNGFVIGSRIIGVVGNNTIVQATRNSTSTLNVYQINLAGSVIRSFQPGNNVPGHPQVRELTDGSVLVLAALTSVPTFASIRFFADGTATPQKNVTITGFYSSATGVFRAALANDRIVLTYDDTTNVNMVDVSLDWPGAVSTFGTVAAVSTSPFTFRTASLRQNGPDIVAIGLNFNSITSTYYVTQKTLYMRKSSVVGVALDSIAPGATGRVYNKGTFLLPVDQDFGFGVVSDQRSASIPGPRAVLIGRNVVLGGMN